MQAETKVSFMAPHDVAGSRLHRAMAYFDDVRGLASDAMTRNSILDNLAQPGVREVLEKQGLIARGGPPERLAELIAKDRLRWPK